MYICVCIYVYVYICRNICVCIYVYVCICMYVYICIKILNDIYCKLLYKKDYLEPGYYRLPLCHANLYLISRFMIYEILI